MARRVEDLKTWRFAKELERRVFVVIVAVGSFRETVDHLGAGLEAGHISPELHKDLMGLADAAIGSAVNLIKYLDTCKSKRSPRNPRKRPPNPEREP
jgi:hypothetical protein